MKRFCVPAGSAWLNSGELEALSKAPVESGEFGNVLAKAESANGLTLEEAAILLTAGALDVLEEAAKRVRHQVYGSGMQLFAPLYLSNACVNDCLYCGFRRSNKAAARKTLTPEELVAEVEYLVERGHRHVLLVSSENPLATPITYIAQAVRKTFSVVGVRQVDVEVGSLRQEEMQQLHDAGASAYVLFQETYEPTTYGRIHPKGLKTDFQWRLTAPERAIAGGLKVGLGALLGLYDWRFETLALMAHALHLREMCGVFPSSISVPRLRAANGAVIQEPPYLVADEDLRRIISVLRLALPQVGIVLSTREPEWLRDELVDSGVTSMSAGSRTSPGGYSLEDSGEQFPVEDHRPLSEIVALIERKGLIPAF